MRHNDIRIDPAIPNTKIYSEYIQNAYTTMDLYAHASCAVARAGDVRICGLFCDKVDMVVGRLVGKKWPEMYATMIR